MSTVDLKLTASAPRGLADLLARELEALGATEVRERPIGVAFTGSLEVAYRACLWSRIANRVFLELAQFEAHDAEALYAAARELPWEAHIDSGATLACEFSGRHAAITHSHFGALKLKDAVVDALRERTGRRPDVGLERPGVRVHAHASGTRVTVSLDLSGESLHRRGYRTEASEAPLKENVAAGILMRAGWPELAREGAPFLDPMCGSGTLVIEAALIAADRAPGLLRDYFGFLGWRQHDAALWERLRAEAQTRARTGTERALAAGVRLCGSDRDARAVRLAQANARRAGVDALTQFEVCDLADVVPVGVRTASDEQDAEVSSARGGLVCTNPPYGVRLEDRTAARDVHRTLGRVLRERFTGWHAAVLTGAPELGLELGIRAHRTHTVWNGAIQCRLLRLPVEPEAFRDVDRPRGRARIDSALRDTPGAQMFANRLRKNLKRLRAWAEANDVTCYRLYDADMPEYAFAIDLYRSADSDIAWLYVQEYAAPASIDPEAVRRRRGEAFSVLPEVTSVPSERIHVRTRRRRVRGEQYRKLGEAGRFHVVAEGGLRFWVNFEDYLDTGLFLDHRITRARLRAVAARKRFLNLFAYTGTATVYAAAGRARSSVTVDLSRTYLDWAQRNLTLNGLACRDHVLVQADCREWLEDARRRRERFDLIFLDPPTFSNSKRMQGVLDTQRDHPRLIEACMDILAPGGLLVFSTNAQRFKLEPSLAEKYDVRDISAETIPEDFARNPKIHRCYEIRARR